MEKSILITGGARSGKSVIAERLVARHAQGAPLYIATAAAGDAEMAERIATHRARRGPEWRTIEAPYDLPAALDQSDGAGPRLVDCLTVWLSNLMLADRDPSEATAALIAALGRQQAPVVLVTNEVGAGIVPENALARRYRDAAGEMNQRVAEACDAVWLAVAGQPLKVKPNDNRI